MHFDLWLPRGSSLGFYARRNALPTHTNYDLMEVIKGANSEQPARVSRSVQVLQKITYLIGYWPLGLILGFFKMYQYLLSF